MTTARIHGIAYRTTALGPGNRAAIWFQGCMRCCKGCMSPDSRPLNGGTEWSVDKLINDICAIENIEGITISGGEPFLQVNALHEFLTGIRSRTSLGVIIYTGNTMDELRRMGNPLVDEILAGLADIVIDGEYVDELNDGAALKGSSNQTVNFITDRYLSVHDLYNSNSRDIQIMIEGNDALLIGVPDRNTLEIWKRTTEGLKKEKGQV